MLRLKGSTTAVLMHHSRTAFGYVAVAPASGVGPAIVSPSFITRAPVTGSTS